MTSLAMFVGATWKLPSRGWISRLYIVLLHSNMSNITPFVNRHCSLASVTCFQFQSGYWLALQEDQFYMPWPSIPMTIKSRNCSNFFLTLRFVPFIYPWHLLYSHGFGLFAICCSLAFLLLLFLIMMNIKKEPKTTRKNPFSSTTSRPECKDERSFEENEALMTKRWRFGSF